MTDTSSLASREKVNKKSTPCMVITTNNIRIEGTVFVPNDIRLLDHLNVTHQTYFAVTDAKIFISPEADPIECEFLLVNKTEAVCIIPM